MTHSLRATIALLMATSLPAVVTAPAAAAVNPDLSNFTVNCLTDYQGGNYTLPVYGDSITVTLLNCQTFNLWDVDNTDNATIDSGTLNSNGLLEANESPEVITVTGAADLEIRDAQGETREFDVRFNFIEPYVMSDPAGSIAVDSSVPVPVDIDEFSVGTSSQVSNFGEIVLGDVTGCTMYAGQHTYTTQAVNVNTAGTYTFRVTGVSPTSNYLDSYSSAGTMLDDPMIVIYETFDPANANNGVVGCNDDLNDLTIGGHGFGDNAFNIDSEGNYIEGHFSYFAKELEPGNYTIVFTSHSVLSSTDWALGETEGTIYFDVWGPAGGLVLGLANTGVNPAFALWTGVALAVTGVAITVARRRAVRA